MHEALQDIHFALRQLKNRPGFAWVAILTLALGIGASTVVFSVVYNGVLFPFPYRSAERLRAISIQDLERGNPGGRGMYTWMKWRPFATATTRSRTSWVTDSFPRWCIPTETSARC